MSDSPPVTNSFSLVENSTIRTDEGYSVENSRYSRPVQADVVHLHTVEELFNHFTLVTDMIA